MIKLFFNICFIMAIAFSSLTHATLLVEDNNTQLGDYISYNGIDIAWASSVNAETWYVSLDEYNTLLAPTTHSGWNYATAAQWDMITALTGDELLALFTRESDGSLIQAFEHWNTLFEGDLDSSNVLNGKINSHWSWSVPVGEDTDNLTEAQIIAQILEIDSVSTSYYDTFYFRTSSAGSPNAPAPVPEPATILIFAVALIVMVSKKRLFN